MRPIQWRAEVNRMINLLSSLASADFSNPKQPPMATILILLLTIALNLVMGFLGRRGMDLDEYRRVSTESRGAQQELMAAMKGGNQRRISKAQKRQKELSQKMMKITGNRTKNQLFYFIPLMLLWPFLRNFFGDVIVATLPVKFPFMGTEMKMFNWYLLCSLTTNIIIQRVLGLTFEIDPEDSALARNL